MVNVEKNQNRSNWNDCTNDRERDLKTIRELYYKKKILGKKKDGIDFIFISLKTIIL